MKRNNSNRTERSKRSLEKSSVRRDPARMMKPFAQSPSARQAFFGRFPERKPQRHVQDYDVRPFKKIPAIRQSSEASASDGRFILENMLGSGGICEVHAALDLRRVEWGDANPRIAIKRLHPDLAENVQARVSLAQEFCVLRHLAHPGVVRVFDLHRESFGMCVSMELLEGHTLQEELRNRPAGLGLSAIRIARMLFDALSFLHDHGVTHGDIKPSNVFMAAEGRIALIDFNVATAIAKPGAACSPVTLGLRESLHLPSFSLRYASPERLQGARPSPQDDIYSACCTIYEAIAGEHPFGRESSQEAMEARKSPKKPRALQGRQWKMIRRGLSFEAHLRPSASDLLKAFSPRRGLFQGLKRLLHIDRGI